MDFTSNLDYVSSSSHSPFCQETPEGDETIKCLWEALNWKWTGLICILTRLYEIPKQTQDQQDWTECLQSFLLTKITDEGQV